MGIYYIGSLLIIFSLSASFTHVPRVANFGRRVIRGCHVVPVDMRTYFAPQFLYFLGTTQTIESLAHNHGIIAIRLRQEQIQLHYTKITWLILFSKKDSPFLIPSWSAFLFRTFLISWSFNSMSSKLSLLFSYVR